MKKEQKQENFAFFYKKVPKNFASFRKSCTFAPANQNKRVLKTKFGVWCNGNTADSGPAFPGSSPGTPTKKIAKQTLSDFSFSLSYLSTFSTSFLKISRPEKPVVLKVRLPSAS